MDLVGDGFATLGLGRLSILLGKNGCGKSRLLKRVEAHLGTLDNIGAVRYISPERGGLLRYDPGVEQSLVANASWLADTRRRNRAEQFRQQSAAQFRRLELLVLRDIEQNPQLRADPSITFGATIARLNGLLDEVYLERGDPSFQVRRRGTDALVDDLDSLSSGESELISLGIEILAFERECRPGRLNVLLADEPDVHLHPDLQVRFMEFVRTSLDTAPYSAVLATHSTALLGAGSDDDQLTVAFMRSGESEIRFRPVDDTLRMLLPVFGAHPLSNVFNKLRPMLVEGEDDARVWQTAVRSSKGRLAVYPCPVDGVPHLNEFEELTAEIISAVYENAVALSLRDGDGLSGSLAAVGPVRRFRLECRAAENLLLTDEVLDEFGGWNVLEQQIERWIERFPEHPHHEALRIFSREADRKLHDIKLLRNDILGLLGTNKPWEVLVGQALASQCGSPWSAAHSATSLQAFIGRDPWESILS